MPTLPAHVRRRGRGFQVDFIAHDGRRIRRSFGDLDAARTYVDQFAAAGLIRERRSGPAPAFHSIAHAPAAGLDTVKERGAAVARTLAVVPDAEPAERVETLAQAAERFLAARRRKRCRESTLESYRRDFTAWARALDSGWETPVDRLAQDAGSVLDLWENASLAPPTIAGRVRHLRILLRWAGAPVEGLDPIRLDEGEPHTYTDDERAAILAAADKAEGWIATFVFLIDRTALRHREALGLRVRDLDLDAGRLRVPPEAAKGRRPRTIPLKAETVERLRLATAGRDGAEYLFGRRGDPHAKRVSASKAASKVFEAAGIDTPPHPLHAIRATTLSRWASERRLDFTTLGELAGWTRSSRYRVAGRYLRADDDRAREAIEAD